MHSEKHGMTRASATVVALAMALAPVGTAYGQTTPGGGTHSGTHEENSYPRSRPSLSDYETTAITRNVDAVRNECADLDPRYRIDCLRKGLIEVAQRIPESGDYAPARAIIAEAAAKLGEVQRKHADPAAEEKKSSGNARIAANRTYKAVKREELAEAMAEATKIIEEAETKLLRAGENSEKRAAHYQQIATAIGSTKVLLRS